VYACTYLSHPSRRCLILPRDEYAVYSCVNYVSLIGGLANSVQHTPAQVVDGCHAFCAIDTHLSEAPPTLFYTSTLMKHAGCGANAALMLVPKAQHSKIRPLWTGWMADLSVLGPLSTGVSLTCTNDQSLSYVPSPTVVA
jgi:hypothetical protein